MEELRVIETTSGRQFKPWATKDDVQDPASVTAIASEIASGKQAIAAAINAKGGEASAMESFTELAQDIQNTPTSGIRSNGIVQSEPFSFLDYVCRQGAYPFTEIDDDSVMVINRPRAFYNQNRLLKVKMTSLTVIKVADTFYGCTSLREIVMPSFANAESISGSELAGINNLENLILGKITGSFYTSTLNGSGSNLRNITIGQDTNVNLNFSGWYADNVISSGQSGIDELNANLQTNLISKLYQGGGKILRLGTTLYDATTQETRDMVTAKGWTLQRG